MSEYTVRISTDAADDCSHLVGNECASAHKMMVGISLLGGVTSETTAMLGLVNDKPVLVFVDNLSNDDEEMRSQVGKNGEYHISRTTKDGLVFYEISEYEDAQLIEYFEKVEP